MQHADCHEHGREDGQGGHGELQTLGDLERSADEETSSSSRHPADRAVDE
jgi:hypothetical protein